MSFFRMMRRYYNIIEFYGQTNKPEKVETAKKELQNLIQTQSKMNFYLDLDFRNVEGTLINEVAIEVK
jgi:hypothetical protein